MTYSPDYRENLADGVLKDMNIENLIREIGVYRKEALEWKPKILVDNDALSGNGVEFRIVTLKDGKSLGASITLNNDEIEYLWDGDSLVDSIADELSLLYRNKLKEELRPKVVNVISNIRLSKRTSSL